MRIKLKKGYQQRLILSAKTKHQLSWRSLSKILGINEMYLALELKNEKRLLSEEIYKKLNKLTEVNYEQYIETRLDDNWGRSKGGLNSIRKPKLLIKKPSKELSEFIGIMLGDGNIWSRQHYYYIHICGDKEKGEAP